jgi:hypothetical protein
MRASKGDESREYANKLEAHLKAEVEKLLEMAETTHDQGNRGLDIPAELGRREERLKKIAQAKAEIERRAQERQAREKADYDEKVAQRQAKRKAGREKAGWTRTQRARAWPARQRPGQLHR